MTLEDKGKNSKGEYTGSYLDPSVKHRDGRIVTPNMDGIVWAVDDKPKTYRVKVNGRYEDDNTSDNS